MDLAKALLKGAGSDVALAIEDLRDVLAPMLSAALEDAAKGDATQDDKDAARSIVRTAHRLLRVVADLDEKLCAEMDRRGLDV